MITDEISPIVEGVAREYFRRARSAMPAPALLHAPADDPARSPRGARRRHVAAAPRDLERGGRETCSRTLEHRAEGRFELAGPRRHVEQRRFAARGTAAGAGG